MVTQLNYGGAQILSFNDEAGGQESSKGGALQIKYQSSGRGPQ